MFFEEMEHMGKVATEETLRPDSSTLHDWLGAAAVHSLTATQRKQAVALQHLMAVKAERHCVRLHSLPSLAPEEPPGVFDRMTSTERKISGWPSPGREDHRRYRQGLCLIIDIPATPHTIFPI